MIKLVIETKTEFKKSSEQFMRETNSIKRNTVKDASRKYEDEDDEVSFYMMNTMNDLSNGNYIHFDNIEEDFIYN